MTWRPILAGERRTKATEAIHAIADGLRGESGDGIGIAHGAAGIALFFAYYGVEFDGTDADEIADELAIAAVGQAREVPHPSLYGGFVGLGWLVHHLFGDEDPSVAAPFDQRVSEWLADPWRGDYDLISGLVGVGVYALEREDPQLIKRVIEALAGLSKTTADGITWHTRPELLMEHQRETAPEGFFNLGLAHGTPGALRFLARASAFVPTAAELADGAAAWILAQRLPEDSASWFPSAVAETKTPTPKARLAWCYGDPGIAASLVASGIDLNRPDLVDFGRRLALAAGQRHPDDGRVVDCGLCHGAVGLAHLYNRMHQATGDAELAEVVLKYIDLAFSMRTGGGIAGFEELHFEDFDSPGVHRTNTGFLCGVAGIGLALIAAVGETEPTWDRLLLCDAINS